MKRWLALLPVVVLVALAALFAIKSLGRDPHVQPAALVGKPLPALVLAPTDGGPSRPIQNATDRPFLINFYASWCAPCAQEAPALDALKSQGIRIVGIAYKDAPEKNRAFLAAYGDPFAVKLMDPDGRAGVEMGVTGPPETYAVNARGIIVAKHVGPMSVEQGRAMIRKAAQP